MIFITQEAFNELINTYKRYVFATIINITHDQNEVEAIAQEVFLQLYLHPPTDEGNIKAYIGKIAANKAIDFNRKKRRTLEAYSLEEAQELGVMLQDKQNIEEELIKKLDSRELRKKISMLPQIYKDVVIQFYFHQLSYKEIAESEGSSVKTIESRLYRARKMLYDG